MGIEPPTAPMDSEEFYRILDTIPKDIPREEAARMIAVWDVNRSRRGMHPKTALTIIQLAAAVGAVAIGACWIARWAG